MLRLLSWKLVLAFFRLFQHSVVGIDNIPKPPFIIAANHEGYLSPSIILRIFVKKLNQPVYSLAAVLWYSFIYLRWFNCITEGNAVNKCVNLLKQGKCILIMPEGRRNYSSTISDYKTGVSAVVLLSGVPVVPVGIKDSINFPWFFKAKVSIGKPIIFEHFPKKIIPRNVLVKKTNQIMKTVASLSNKKIKLI
ncbi:1-acyl-sn-glycerol-3-phosphate acyltransferase [Candidatus Woesearchaeota archaeon]|nr:1-acyl-sn-glycerol-3-phosphate acyltransferase [Candidatus Woesearchaeota archaeon]